ncbi:MAG: DUF4365 domain-containing protein [Xanthomonadaceae bacterium]|nr:DUF4365 domain-containing protein [Xanthomonadaceae bacterium]
MPNFPDNQKTGTLTELDVQRLFTDWSWNTGRDRIDSGYDLFVTPHHDKYKGARFMVQVKGTARPKTKGTITAPVSKKRLREYAESILPVFIVRVTAEGGIYWCHAQAWAQANVGRLDGAGVTGVKIDKTNDLRDREAFETYLLDAFLASPTLGKPTSHWESKVGFLNSLDPKLGVRVQTSERETRIALVPKGEDFEAELSMKFAATESNLAHMRDVIGFGLPGKLDSVNIEITGSPLFDHIPSRLDNGAVTVRTKPIDRSVVRLRPGTRHSITASVLPIEVEAYRGSTGAALTSANLDSYFDLLLKIERKPGAQFGEALISYSISLREGKFTGLPIREIDMLRPLTDWADQVALQEAAFLEVSFMNKRLPPIVITGTQLQALTPLLDWLQALSRLHIVASHFSSDFCFHQKIALDGEELDGIDKAYALLKGERFRVSFPELSFTTSDPVEKFSCGKLLCTTMMILTVQEQELGRIPVAIELSGFVAVKQPGADRVRIVPREGAQAWMSFDDDRWVELGSGGLEHGAMPTSVLDSP